MPKVAPFEAFVAKMIGESFDPENPVSARIGGNETKNGGKRRKRWFEPPLFGETVLDDKNDRENSRPSGHDDDDVFDHGPKQVRPIWWMVAWILMDYLQIHGILWVVMLEWGLPKYWRWFSSISVLFNLDLWSFVVKNSRIRFSVYAAIWIGTLSILAAALFGALRIFAKERPKLKLVIGKTTASYLLAFGDLFILPVCILMSFVSLGAFITALIGSIAFLKLQHTFTMSCIVSSQNYFHDEFIVQKEVEWYLRLKSEWFVDHLRLVSFFERTGIHFRLLSSSRKILLIAIAVFFKNRIEWQTGAICIVMFSYAAYMIVFSKIFQNEKFDKINNVLEISMAFKVYLCALSAVEARNAFSVEYVQVPLLLSATFSGLLAAFIAVPVLYEIEARCNKKRLKAKTSKDIARSLLNDPETRSWIAEMHSTQYLLLCNRFTIDKFYPVGKCFEKARNLERFLVKAREKQTILRNTLQECLEDIYCAIDINASESFFPNKELEQTLPKLSAMAHKHDLETILMNPRKKRILKKIRALANWGILSDSEEE